MIGYEGELEERIAVLEGELRDYERSTEKANEEICALKENWRIAMDRVRDLEETVRVVERENRDKCLELAEKAFEIRELRGVVDAAAAFVNGKDYMARGEAFDELRKRLDALDLPDDAPRPESPDAGYVVWHRLDGAVVRLIPIPAHIETRNPVLRLEVLDEGERAAVCHAQADPQPFPMARLVIEAQGDAATLDAVLEYHGRTRNGSTISAPHRHTGAPGNSVDTRVERDPEP